MKFKAGDRVKIRTFDEYYDGMTATVLNAGDGFYPLKLDRPTKDTYDWVSRPKNVKKRHFYLTWESEIILLRGGVRMKGLKFIVLYELDGDPYEVFHTKKDAEKRIADLVEDGAEDIKLITVAKVEEVISPTKFELKEVK